MPMGGISRRHFVSEAQSFSSGALLTLAHGLGVAIKELKVFLVCITGEHGYTAGDVVLAVDHSLGAESKGMAFWSDADYIYARLGSQASAFRVLNKGTGSTSEPTNTKWGLIFEAWA